MRSYSLDDVRATLKRRDSWWTVFLVDPVACRVALFVANRTEITPNTLTRISLILGMGSAACFAVGHLVLGAVLFYISFMIDCVDGKIARLKGTGTPFGLWLDYVGDRIRVVCCAAGLAYGQYATTGRLAYILLGAGIAILDLFRYVNAPQMKRVRQTVKARRRVARLAELTAVRDAMAVESLTQNSVYHHHDLLAYDPAAHDLVDHDPALYEHLGFDPAHYEPSDHRPMSHRPMEADPSREQADHGPAIPRQASPGSDFLGATQPVSLGALSHAPPSPRSPGTDPYDQEADRLEVAGPPPTARQRIGLYLAEHRVRTHLMSGIEFHAAVFVLAPLIGPPALLPVTTGAGALLVLNEIFLVYRMWLSTRALGVRGVPGTQHPGERHVRSDQFFTGV